MVFPNVIEAVGQIAFEAFFPKPSRSILLAPDLDQQGFVLKFNTSPLRKIGKRGFGNSLLVRVGQDHGQGNEIALDPDKGEIRLGLLLDQIDGFRSEAALCLVFNFLPHFRNTGFQLASEYPVGQGYDFGGMRELEGLGAAKASVLILVKANVLDLDVLEEGFDQVLFRLSERIAFGLVFEHGLQGYALVLEEPVAEEKGLLFIQDRCELLDLQLVEFFRGGLVFWSLLVRHELSTLLEVSEYAFVSQGHPNLVLLLIVVVNEFLLLEFDAPRNRKEQAYPKESFKYGSHALSFFLSFVGPKGSKP